MCNKNYFIFLSTLSVNGTATLSFKSDLHYVTFADLMTSREYYFLSALLCNGSKNKSNFCISVKFVDSCFAFVKCLRFDTNQISIDLI